MVFLDHHKDYGYVKDQALTNPNIPKVEELIDCLIWVLSSDVDSLTAPELSALIFNSSDCGG